MVEHNLAKVGVASSSLVSRSKHKAPVEEILLGLFICAFIKKNARYIVLGDRAMIFPFLRCVVTKRSRYQYVVILLLLGLLSGYGYAETYDALDGVGGDFALTDQNGFEFRLSDFEDKIVLLTFGYTHCPDVCPNTLFNLRSVMEKLEGQQGNVHVLFVTLDPERDYVERLQAFVEYFNPNFIGLSGSVKQVAYVANRYGITFHKHFLDDSGLVYSIDHNAGIFLLDRQNQVRKIYQIGESPNVIAQGVKALLAE